MDIFPVLGVVYKSKDGNWRGFCYPYDVACNTMTKEEAMKNLMELMETYEENLSNYNSPRHLIVKKLSEKEDQDVFKKIWPEVSRKFAERLRVASNPTKFSDRLSQDTKFTVDSGKSTVSYSNRPLALASSE